jgi:hypothetical protein
MEIASEQMYAPGIAILLTALAFNTLGGGASRRAGSDQEAAIAVSQCPEAHDLRFPGGAL